MRRLTTTTSAIALGLLFAAGCAEDPDLNSTPPVEDTGGSSSNNEASPPVDTDVPDTLVATDSDVPDTTIVDTGTDAFMLPEVLPDTTGFDLATIDTAVLDSLVGPTCKVVADCPGADLECAKRECVGGRCTVAFVAAGTAGAMQTAGDCKRSQCNGAGLLVAVYDPTDLPVDKYDCIEKSCPSATPTFTDKPLGFPCTTDGGTRCDGAGKCVQCFAPTECPAAPNECSTRACVANKCVFNGVAAGTPTVLQTAGDCRTQTCDGAGGITSIADNSDVPPSAGTCSVGGCTSGVPTQLPKDPAFTPSVEGGGRTVCGSYDSCRDGCITPLYCQPGGTVCNECDVAADCSARTLSSVCVQWGCDNHFCVEEPKASPTPITCSVDGCPGTCSAGSCDYTCAGDSL